MLDSKLKPWLIEVNHSPSLFTDSTLDARIKEGLVTETLSLLNLSVKDKRNAQLRAQAQAKQRLYGGGNGLSSKFSKYGGTAHQQRTQADANDRERELIRQQKCEKSEAY